MGKLNDWLQTIGNIGILLGLFFVGYQLYQDRELKKAELAFLGMDSNIQLSLALAGEDPFRAIVKLAVNPESATDEDRYIASKVFDALMFSRRRLFLMEAMGLVQPGYDGFVDHEFGTDVGFNYLDTQLDGWGISDHARQSLVSAMRSEGFRQRLRGYLERDLSDQAVEN